MNRQIELMKKFMKCVEMCEKDGVTVDPWNCVKYYGEVATGHLGFTHDHERYDFAVGIVEGKPVFIGDMLYYKEKPFEVLGLTRSTGDWNLLGTSALKLLSWNPPKTKRVFMLNGEELPCPENEPREDTYNIILFDEEYGFSTNSDRDKVVGSLKKLLETARTNE